MNRRTLAGGFAAAAVLWPFALHAMSPWADSRFIVWLLHDALLPGGAAATLAWAALAKHRDGRWRYRTRGMVVTALLLAAGVTGAYVVWAWEYEWTNRGASVNCALGIWLFALPLFIVATVIFGLGLSREP